MICMLFSSTTLYAESQTRWGIKLGMNLNDVDVKNLGQVGPHTFSAANRNGFTGGFVVESPLFLGLYCDASFLYTYAENKFSSSTIEGMYKETLGKSFIQIPVNLKWKLALPGLRKLIIPMAYTGPSFTIKLDDSTFQGLSTKKFEAGWGTGLGVELVEHIQIMGGYTFGINNIANAALNTEFTNLDIRHNYWTITAAILF